MDKAFTPIASRLHKKSLHHNFPSISFVYFSVINLCEHLISGNFRSGPIIYAIADTDYRQPAWRQHAQGRHGAGLHLATAGVTVRHVTLPSPPGPRTRPAGPSPPPHYGWGSQQARRGGAGNAGGAAGAGRTTSLPVQSEARAAHPFTREEVDTISRPAAPRRPPPDSQVGPTAGATLR